MGTEEPHRLSMQSSLQVIMNRLKNDLCTCAVFILFLMSVVAGAFGKEQFIHSVLFWLFEVLVILIPGMFIASFFHSEKMRGPEYLMLSYVSGYTASIALYIVIMFISGNDAFLRIVTCLYSFAFCALCIRHKCFERAGSFKCDPSERRLLILMLFSVFAAKLLIFELSELPPVYSGRAFLHHDLLYWVDDVVACKHRMPPMNIRKTLDMYHYHYLGAAQIACISKFTGISALKATVVYSYIQPVMLMVLSSVSVICRLLRHVPARVFTAVSLFFTTGAEVQTLVTYRGHVITMPMTFDISYGFLMCVFWIVLVKLPEERVSFPDSLYPAFFIAAATGIKGTTGALALMCVGLLYLYMLIKNRNIKEALRNGLFTLLLFAGVYAVILSGTLDKYLIKERVNVTAEAEDAKEDEEPQTKAEPAAKDGAAGAVDVIRSYIQYFFRLNPVIVVLAGVSLLLLLFKKRSCSFETVIMCILILTGTLMGFFIKMVGNSQMYFTLNVLFFMFILAGQGLDCLPEMLNEKIASAVILAGLVPVLAMSFRTDFEDATHTGLVNAKNIIASVIKKEQPEGQGIFSGDYVVLKEEYDAYAWVRDNTDRNAVILSDLALIEREGNRTDVDNYVVPAFAERVSLRYRSDNKREKAEAVFAGNTDMIKEMKPQADYLIVHKNVHPAILDDSVYASLVYENDEVAVLVLPGGESL